MGKQMNNENLDKLFKDISDFNEGEQEAKGMEDIAGLKIQPFTNEQVEMAKNESYEEYKRVPMRPEWEPMMKELDKQKKVANDYLSKMLPTLKKVALKLEAKRKLFFATIETDLDIYDNMEYDRENNEIVIYREKGEDASR